MKPAIKDKIQILVEQRLHKAGEKGLRPKTGFREFSYTRAGHKTGKIVATGNTMAPGQVKMDAASGSAVTVIHFSGVGDLRRAQRLARKFPAKRRCIIAVASPKVFNQPKLRSQLTEANVEFLVEDPDLFEIELLTPWITRIADRRAEGEASQTAGLAASAGPEDETLHISKRLRDSGSGRLNARKIAALLGISMADLARICGVSKQALSQRPASSNIQEKLQPLEEVAQFLAWCGGDSAKLRAWLNRPHRDFPVVNGRVPSPMDLIRRGKAGIVAGKVHNLRTGQPA